MVDEEKTPGSLFRRQALEYIMAPASVEKWVQNPRVPAWTLLAGISLSVISLLFWLFFGSIGIQKSGKGVMLSSHDAMVYIAISQSAMIKPGMKIYAKPLSADQSLNGSISGKVIAVDNFPVTLNQNLTSVQVHLSKPLLPGSLIRIRINVRRQSPWSLLISRDSHA